MDKRIYLAAILLWAISLSIYFYLGSEPKEISTNLPTITIGETSIPVEIAATSEAERKGLSGRESLNEDSGMLFVFKKPALYRFWMPDMHFPIDIIWINEAKVVDISARVSNEFDPQNPKYYIPKEEAQFVLEVNAGFAENKKIKIGDPVLLP